MKQLHIACLGDSLTYGYGIQRDKTWIFVAGQELAPRVVLHNHGLNGDTTTGMLERLHADILPSRPDAVLIMGGANDIAFGGSAATARANIPTLVHSVAERDIMPLIGIPLPFIPSPNEGWGSLNDLIKAAAEYDAYAGWLRDFCVSEGCRAVDFRAWFEETMKRDNADPGSYFFDGLHFNARGHQVLAACMAATVALVWGKE
jgi:lysophospholipase L1-like esterase